ncbi:conserved hypothetical protein [Burkholderia cenocepacia]|nr:conserved hypothetical protein [Burkholderia cenocepacia]
MLPGPGSGGAQPVPRHDQAPHRARARRRRDRYRACRRRAVPQRRPGPAVRDDRQRGGRAGGRRRRTGRDQARRARQRHGAPRFGRRPGARVRRAAVRVADRSVMH